MFDQKAPELLTFGVVIIPPGIVLLALFGIAGWGLFIWTILSKRPLRAVPPMQPVLKEEDWLLDLRDVVERRLHEFDLKAEDLARELGMSRTRFFRRVKDETGLTPSQYLQEARCQRARCLLETSGVDSVKAAAISVGFRNGKYFSRLFRERFGAWPSEYLKKTAAGVLAKSSLVR